MSQHPDFLKEFITNTGEKLEDEEDDLSLILAFLTPDEGQWEKANIKKGLEHFTSFYSSENKETFLKDKNKIFKNKTNESFDSIDICMMYDYIVMKYKIEENILKIKNENIKLNEVDSESKLKFLYYFSISDYSSLENFFISNFKKNKNKNVLNYLFDDKNSIGNTNEITYEKLKNRALILPFINSTLSDKEAIAFLFKTEKIDISGSLLPLNEMKYYFLCKNENRPYVPQDSNLRKIYEKNKNFFFSNKYFKEDFHFFYGDDDISKLKKADLPFEESNCSKINKDYYIEESKKRNLFSGFMPNTNLEERTVYQHFTNENIVTFMHNNKVDDKVFSFGKKDKYIYFTRNELIEFFKSRGDYTDPTSYDTCLTEYSILKFKCFFLADDIVKYIEEKRKEEMVYFTELKTKYVSLGKQEKEAILGYVKNIFNFAMKLRGWDGTGKFVMKKEEFQKRYSENFDKINIKEECDNINTLRNLIASIEIIKNLKILEFMNNKYYVTEINIYDKYIGIVEANKDDESCIKTGSNYLVYTCYYYYKIFKEEDLININCFEEI
jgi:hypothetical protein